MGNAVAALTLGVLIALTSCRQAQRTIRHVRGSGPVFGEAHVATKTSTVVASAGVSSLIVWLVIAEHGFVSVFFFAWCIWWSVQIALVDIDTHVITVQSVAIAAGGTVILGTLLSRSLTLSVSMLVGALIGAIIMKVVEIASRGDLGHGDVVVSVWLGLIAGWRSLDTVVIGVMWAFLCAGVVATALIATRRSTLRSHLPFGPFLILGLWVGVLR